MDTIYLSMMIAYGISTEFASKLCSIYHLSNPNFCSKPLNATCIARDGHASTQRLQAPLMANVIVFVSGRDNEYDTGADSSDK